MTQGGVTISRLKSLKYITFHKTQQFGFLSYKLLLIKINVHYKNHKLSLISKKDHYLGWIYHLFFINKRRSGF